MSLPRGISSVRSCSEAADSRQIVASGFLVAIAIHAAVVSSIAPARRNVPGAIRSYSPSWSIRSNRCRVRASSPKSRYRRRSGSIVILTTPSKSTKTITDLLYMAVFPLTSASIWITLLRQCPVDQLGGDGTVHLVTANVVLDRNLRVGVPEQLGREVDPRLLVDDRRDPAPEYVRCHPGDARRIHDVPQLATHVICCQRRPLATAEQQRAELTVRPRTPMASGLPPSTRWPGGSRCPRPESAHPAHGEDGAGEIRDPSGCATAPHFELNFISTWCGENTERELNRIISSSFRLPQIENN